MKQFILNEKNLRNLGVCKEGIEFIKTTGLEGINFDDLNIGNDDKVGFVKCLNKEYCALKKRNMVK